MWAARIIFLTPEQRQDPKYLRKIAKQLRYVARKEARRRAARAAA